MNVLQSMVNGLNAGRQARELHQQEQDRNALRSLAPQIMQGDPGAYDQAAAISPEAAGQYQQAGDSQLRRLQGAINYIEQAKKSGSAQAVEAAYQSVRPYLSRFGQEPPMTFAEAEPKFEEAKARIAMIGQQKGEQFTLSPGSQRFDSAGNVVASVPFAPERPQNAVFQTDAQGNGWWLRPGQAPIPADMPSQASAGLDQPNHGAAALTGAPLYAAVGDVISPMGGRITSTNGGQHNAGSAHPGGGAVDVGMGQESPERQAQILAALQNDPRFRVVDERVRPQGQEVWSGPHLHVEPSMQSPQANGRINFGKPQGNSYQTMTPQEVKALGLPDGTIAQRSPTGQVQIINKPRDLPSGGQVIDNGDGTTTYIPAGKVSEGERNAAGFYQRMVSANAEMQRLTDKGYDPSNRRDYYTAGGEILNPLATDEGRQFQQAKANWVRANLRKESGAAIGKSEMENEIANYFPIPGDDAATIEQKARNRKVVEQAMRTAAGAALAPMATQPKPAQAKQSGPQPGTVEDGYRFKGGNPADPNSWERI